jgi:PAS domain S-box-containing protein
LNAVDAPSPTLPSAPDIVDAAPGADRAARWARRVCIVLGAYAAVVGLTSFLGWAFDVRRLTDWDNNGISIQPNATVCVFFAGLALLFLAAQWRRAARWLGLVVALIAWATAFEWLSGVNLGIDGWFLFGRDWGRVGVVSPARMGPPGTASWCLIGLALLLAGSRGRARRLVPALGLGVALISAVSLLGYLFGAGTLYTLPRLTIIAMQTATCILAVGLGLVASEPARQPMALLLSNTTAGVLSRRVFPLTLLVPAALGWIFIQWLNEGYYDAAFGSAARTGVNTVLYTVLAWWMLKMVGARERELRQSKDDLAAALREVANERERYAVTLSSIGDGVIATDPQARITFMNPVSQRLTGWLLAEAQGRPLLDVFNIVNETTRVLVENPVDKCLRLGGVVGLANHTVLIARDGTEWPIDDSAAPIHASEQGVGGGGIIGVVMVFHEISQRRMAEIRLQASEVRYRRLFEAAHDGIIILDPATRRITDVNPFMLKLLAASRGDVVGKRLFEIGLFPDEAACEAALDKVAATAAARFDSVSVRDRNGRAHPVEIVANLYQEGDAPVIQCNVRDDSERAAFERERAAHLANEQSLRMEAESANRAKDMFLATLSHEIRTPVNAIVGWMSILRKPGRTEEDLREGLDVIERNARAQTQLIDDVMDVSRIVTGKLRLEMQPCDLRVVVRAGIDAVRTAALARGVTLEEDLDPAGRGAAASAVCDPVRVQQIVWNLVTNAVKFTPKGGTVRVRLERDKSAVKIIVSDTGLGIGPDLLPFVFDRFRQGDSSTRRKFGGLGLGLSIVKHLAELHGGSVRASSEGEGKGSTFTVMLPVRAVQVAEGAVAPAGLVEPGDLGAAAGGPAGGKEPPVRLDGLRVLVVDDEPDARRVLTRVLQDAGAIVAAAGSVAEAKRLLDAIQPNVLVSDLGMPDEDGYDLIRDVRAKGHTAASLPAVALTAFAGPGYARTALVAGFQVHVPKPIDPHDLILVVGSLAGRTGQG